MHTIRIKLFQYVYNRLKAFLLLKKHEKENF